MAKKRVVVAAMGNGHLGLIEEDIPALKDGAVLVEVHSSLVSPGTELKGWKGLQAQLDNPEVDAEPKPFGYSNAGVVSKTAGDVGDLKVGDRAACIGGGYAMHTDFAVVPHNLCVKLPDTVSFGQGSYGMLAATALQALRRGQPQLGEYVSVVGLGIVGQLAAQLYQLAGCYVIGWDTMAERLETAKSWGITATVLAGKDDEVEVTRAFTNGYGLDGSVFALAGDANIVMEKTEKCLKCSPDGHPEGTIVVVGAVSFDYNSSLTNADIRKASRTGAGYHDETWEFGKDYPPVFMRWTTKSNLELCIRLIAEGRLNVDCLTTHTIAVEDVDSGISAIIGEPEKILGVIFEMKH